MVGRLYPAVVFLLSSAVLVNFGQLYFVLFGYFGHFQTPVFLLFSAVLGIFLDACLFWGPCWPF